MSWSSINVSIIHSRSRLYALHMLLLSAGGIYAMEHEPHIGKRKLFFSINSVLKLHDIRYLSIVVASAVSKQAFYSTFGHYQCNIEFEILHKNPIIFLHF